MEENSITLAAKELAANRLRHGAFDGFSADIAPVGEPAAYKVQDEIHKALSKRGLGWLAGHKIGCTTPVMQAFLGIDHPCSGGIFSSKIYRNDAVVSCDEFHRPGVECEIAVRLKENIDPADAPFDLGSLVGCIDGVAPAIEIVDDRYQNFRDLSIETLIADDFFGSACVLGETVTDWRDLNLVTMAGRTKVNGKVVGEGKGSDILGHPLEALVWLANNCARHERGLSAGDLILLGSLVQVQWLQPGDIAEVEIDGLGCVNVQFQS